MDLQDFLVSPIPQVSDFAQRAQKIEQDYNSGKITEAEAKELTSDLIALKHINKEMTDLEAQRELWQVVKVLQNIKFFASLI